MTNEIMIPKEKLQVIYQGFNLVNQGIDYPTLENWYVKAYQHNGTITFIALVAALVKVQGAVNQNADLLIAAVEKINNGVPIDNTLVAGVKETRAISLKDFVNTLFNIVEA